MRAGAEIMGGLTTIVEVFHADRLLAAIVTPTTQTDQTIPVPPPRVDRRQIYPYPERSSNTRCSHHKRREGRGCQLEYKTSCLADCILRIMCIMCMLVHAREGPARARMGLAMPT